MQALPLSGMHGREERAARRRRPDALRRGLLRHPHLRRKDGGGRPPGLTGAGCTRPTAMQGGLSGGLTEGTACCGNGATELERRHHALLPLFDFAGELVPVAGHRRRVPRRYFRASFRDNRIAREESTDHYVGD
jgi:hypothetical protein